jgi:2'-phosphotransferase
MDRKLVKILRHQIRFYGLNCDERGFVCVDDIFKYVPDLTIDKLINIVDTNSKKRLELINNNNKYYIRAVQGHNKVVGSLINNDIAFELIVKPLNYCIHGTERQYIESIKKNGLNRMSRKHIHFVSEINENKQTSGYKNKSDVLIFIDMNKCMDDGIKFYKSKNNVILSEGINGIILPKYFKSIESR